MFWVLTWYDVDIVRLESDPCTLSTLYINIYSLSVLVKNIVSESHSFLWCGQIANGMDFNKWVHHVTPHTQAAAKVTPCRDNLQRSWVLCDPTAMCYRLSSCALPVDEVDEVGRPWKPWSTAWIRQKRSQNLSRKKIHKTEHGIKSQAVMVRQQRFFSVCRLMRFASACTI